MEAQHTPAFSDYVAALKRRRTLLLGLGLPILVVALLLAVALPSSAQHDDRNPFSSKADLEEGSRLYRLNCGVCHGDSAVSGGVIPDLRLSPITRDATAWDRIVRGGERSARGMVSFSAEVSAEDSEKVRAYVIHRAHEVRKIEQAASAPAAPADTPPAAAPK